MSPMPRKPTPAEWKAFLTEEREFRQRMRRLARWPLLWPR